MLLRKALSIGMAAGVLAMFTAMSASAQVETGIASYGALGTGNVSYNQPGSPGFLISSPPNGALTGKLGQGISAATIVFGPLAPVGPTVVTGTTFDQILAAGSFQVVNGSTILLQGTFGSSDLSGVVGTNSGVVNLQANSVTYGPVNPGTFFPAGFSLTNGALGVAFTSTTPFAVTGTGATAALNPFTGTDVVTFSAQAIPPSNVVPEASSLALLLPGLIPLGICLRRRRRAVRK